MRRALTILVIAVVAIVVLLVLAVSFLNVDRFRPRIQSDLQAKLGRPVTLGQLHLHLFPFSIKVDGLSIAESPAFPSAQPFATAKEVFASADLMSIIHGNPQIRDLTLQQPQIELIRNAAGAWNFSTLGNTSAPTGQPSTAPKPAAEPAPASTSTGEQQGGLTLDQLKITNGQVAITDLKTKSPRSVYNNIDLTLTGFAPGKAFDLDADVHFPGQGKELVSFKGKAGPLASGAGAQSFPIDGQLSVEQVALAGLNSFSAGSIPPNTDAVISGQATVSSQGGTIAAKGTLNLDNAVMQGAKVDAPINTQYDLKYDQRTSQIAVTSGSVKIGPTTVALSGTVDAGVTPANLNVHLGTRDASITELSRLASLFGAASNSSDSVKGDVTADLLVTGTAKAPQVQGNISSNKVQAQDIVLTNVKSAVKMNNGVLTLAPVTAGIFGGQEAGTITLDTKPAHPQCAINTRFTGVDANNMLSTVSSVKNTLYGNLAADANLNFVIDAGANVAKTLNGTLNFNLANGRLQNVNILNEIAKVGKFLNAAPAQQSGNATTLQKFAGTLNIQNGVANTNNLVAVIPEGSLSAIGSMNLVSQALDMHMSAVLANSMSKAVGGNGIGGYLNTALANNKGELVLPVIVTGSMAHPVFAPDVQAIAKMKLSHLLPTTGDPSKLASGLAGSILGGALGGKQQPAQNGNQQQQQNPLNSILNGLKKRK